MATLQLDTPHLSTTYAVAESTLQTLLDAPTTELVRSFLERLSEFAKEHDILKAEKLRSDVELETAVRAGENRARQMRDSVQNNLAQVETLRRQLGDSETARAQLETELQKLKSSSTTSSSELEKLQSRISTLEAANRNTIILLDSKSAAHDRLAEDLSLQQQKIIALRRETSELEEKLQRAEHASMTSKFREQNLQQEINLLKKSGDWHEDELKRRTAEHTRFRKEKAVQIAELQRTCDDTTQSVETLRKTEAILRNRLDEGLRKLEDTLAKNQSLEQESSTLQESFRAELDSANRLAELQKQSAATSRARLQDVQAQLDRSRDEAADEVGRLQAEVDTERREKQVLEQKISDLETNVEILESALADNRRASRPATPRGPVNGVAPHTPGRGASPGVFSSPVSSRMKVNVTQLYSENAKMKSELDGERRRNEKLRATMDDMIQDLEKQQPGIEELRIDHERLQADIQQLSNLLEETTKARDDARKDVRSLQGKVSGLNTESELLKQELRDLSIQIRFLLLEAKAREDGMENLSPADQALLAQAASGEIDLPEISDMSETQQLISQRLTVYGSIAELQEKNVKLLYLTRKLGEEMEGEEARARNNQSEQDQKELEDLRSRIAHHQEEIKSMTIVADSYTRERDMFRRMLSHRGQIPPDADLSAMFSQSTNTQPLDASRSLGPRDPDAPDFNLLIKELQSQYDAYRRESSTDQATLKEQLHRISKDKSELQAEISKTSSQLTLAHERYELLQSNFASLRAENAELQKRSSALGEVAVKQDVRTQQVAEDLMEARSLTDGLRNENANLKAERALWKNIEARLGEDNRELMDERSRLNKMISDLQSLQNERELTDSETRRRLQARTDDLQSELQTTKRKLDDEIAECKKANQRREYDQEQSHGRIEDLLKALGITREELVAAKTQRDQLQTRVDELKIDLRNAEEKTLVLQPRLTSRANENLEDQENRLTAEQELAIQVSDLRRDLELARNELHQANEHVEQYRSIAQAAEEELQSLSETNDQYREEMDRIGVEKDTRIQDLEKRVEEISSELASTHSELSELRTKQDEYTSMFADQRQMFESEISRLRDEAERLSEMSRLHQADLKAQAEIAQRAQQAYEDELVKHADAAKALQAVRQEFGELKTQVAGFRAEAEAAKANLQDNEANWSEMKNRYENEIIDLKTRREDVNTQNRRLHQQLETVSVQIAELKQARPTEGAQDAGTLGAGSNTDEIMKWLRNEKEIVEVQLELSNQEAKRYKQKLERTEAQLDETIEKLNQERQSQIDRDQATMNHGKLLESINQLNLFRESNASLRNEARQAQSQLADRTAEVETLSAQLEPLRARIGEIENALETKEGEIKLAQEDRDRWQKRNQDILQRYDRVDPAELEGLKNQIESLTQERDALQSEKQSLQEQVDTIPDMLQSLREELNKVSEERRQKLIESAKTKAREQNVIIRDKTSQLQQAQQDFSRVSEEVEAAKRELEKLKAERAAQAAQSLQTADVPPAEDAIGNEAEMTDVPTSEAAPSNQEQTSEAQAHVQELEAQLQGAQTQLQDAYQQLQEEQLKLQEEQNRYSTLDQEALRLRERIVALEERVSELEQKLAASESEMQNLRDGATTATQIETVAPDIAALQTQLASLTAELEAARQVSTVHGQAPAINDGSSEFMPGLMEAELAERRAQLELEYEERSKAAETKYHKHTEGMKNSLNKKVKDLKEKWDKDQNAATEKLRSEHSTELERITAEHSKQLQQLNGGEGSGAAPIASEDAKPGNFEPTEQQIKDLVAKNPTVLDIVKRNVQAKLRASQEQLRAEYDKKAQEAEASVQKALENAVSLERKRQNVKFTMAERRAKEASVKVEFIERAATDTPQRPVGEVWSIIASKVKGVGSAGDAPPSLAAPAAQTLGESATLDVAMTLDAATLGKPATAAPATATTSKAPAPKTADAVPNAPATPISPAAPAPLAKATPAAATITTAGPAPTATITTAMAPPAAPAAPAAQAANPGVPVAPKRRPSGVPFAASQAAAKSGQQQKKRAPSLPAKPAQVLGGGGSGSGIPRPGAGRGRGTGAGEGGAGAGVGTVASTGAGGVAGAGAGVGRAPGSGIPRGRGRGQGQGGAKGRLNPNAKQFSPDSVQVAGAAGAKPGTGGAAASIAPAGAAGNAGAKTGTAAAAGSKRPHDEAGVGGQAGNAEKRPRNDG